MKTIARNALIAALYIAFTSLWGWTATGPALNIRLATSLYVLPALDPALLWGPALGNGLSTLLTGGHPIDAGLGVLMGLLAGWCAQCLRSVPVIPEPPGSLIIPGIKANLSPLAVMVPALFVPLWVSWLYHAPLGAVYAAVAIGQAASTLVAWVVVLPAARRVLGQATNKEVR